MPGSTPTLLVVGASGSIGRLVVDDALRSGFRVRALVRDASRASVLPSATEIVVGDLTDVSTLAGAIEGIDAVVFTHGSHGGGRAVAESVDYGAVQNILQLVGSRPVRIALMTAIGVTVHDGAYNRAGGGHDWKRRSERLVRASGHEYTIVRPGWFDYNSSDENRIVLLQGDRRRAGNSSDGVIARRAIARVLVGSLTSPAAARTTFELIAEKGQEQMDLEPVFAALDTDQPQSIDGVHDLDNFPYADEPEPVRARLEALRGIARA